MKLIWYHRLICLWLAAFVLIGSSGHVVAEHWCKMRGKSVEVLLTRKDCRKQCSDKPANSSKTYSFAKKGPIIYKSPCCKDFERFSRLEPKSQLFGKVFELNPPPIGSPEDFVTLHWLTTLLLTESTPHVPSWTDDPPSRSGRHRLTQHCTWLI